MIQSLMYRYSSQLKQAILDKDMLGAALLVAKQFQPATEVITYKDKIRLLADTCHQRLNNLQEEETRFRTFVQCFYNELAFSGNEQEFFASKYSLLNQVLDYRTGIPVTISIVFCHMARILGFEAYGVNFPGHFLIRYEVSKEKALFIDPLTGQFMQWQELESLYFSIVGEVDEEEMPVIALDAAGTEETVVRLLHNLKASFIKEEKFQEALSCVDLLVQLCPDDPYERRDRGFLLHQLDCHKVAMADYQFFIDQCPKDPAAQLLKMQMKHLDSLPVVLH